MPRYDKLPGPGQTQRLPKTNDKTGPAIELSTDGTGRMTARDTETGKELGRGRGALADTHRQVAEWVRGPGRGGRGTRRGQGSIVVCGGGLGQARAIGTDTGHHHTCPMFEGADGGCSCE